MKKAERLAKKRGKAAALRSRRMEQRCVWERLAGRCAKGLLAPYVRAMFYQANSGEFSLSRPGSELGYSLVGRLSGPAVTSGENDEEERKCLPPSTD